ncbi:MAG: LLM class flavin-dependent oxidoreductase, partial [Halieaceae bacterium]
AATRALWTDAQAEYHGDYIDFDPVWADPKPLQAGGPPIYMGAMGPLGVKHAAQWADGWYPVDIALPDIAQDVTRFKELVAEQGRDPETVAINLQIMDTGNLDKLKLYRDLGIERATVGVAIDMWDKPDQIMPMIDQFAEIIPELKD